MEENPGIYIVNTNATYMSDAWEDMLSERKASAYYDRKYAVTSIAKGSKVYLYHTGTGIIAKGKSTTTYKQTDYDEDPIEEFYVPLKFEWKLDNPAEWDLAVKAWEINQKLNSGYRFRQTAFAISQEMANAIDEVWKERQQARRQPPI